MANATRNRTVLDTDWNVSPAEYRDIPFDVVAIAASLGGPHTLIEVLSALPPNFPADIVVVQHRHASQTDILPEMLNKRSTLPVSEARSGELLRGGRVFIAPTSFHLVVGAAGRLHLVDGPRVQFACPSADVLFGSVARHYHERAIGVVLTGKLSDGAAGARAIALAGGRVLVQDPMTAKAAGMPRAAIAAGCAHFVLSPRGIASALVALTMIPGAAALFRRPLTAPRPRAA